MRAIVVERWMEPSELEIGEVPEPQVAPNTLAIDVRAAGCNFFDILMVQGRYQVKPPFPFVPGAEVAGVVREVGPGVEGFTIGDRVFGTAGLGASPRPPCCRRAGPTPCPRACPSRKGLRSPSSIPPPMRGWCSAPT